MIYTSYFPYAKKVPHPIAISRSIPRWYEGEVYEKLAPSWELLNAWNKGKGISQKEYTERYINELASRGVTVEMLKQELPEECTLLCWETPLAFCHRHIVAWILKNAGIEAKEWTPDNESTRKPKASSKGKRRSKKQADQSEPAAVDSTGDLLLQ